MARDKTPTRPPDIDEWQPSPRVARLAAKYTETRWTVDAGGRTRYAAGVVLGGWRISSQPTFATSEEASAECYRLACVLDAIVENELRKA